MKKVFLKKKLSEITWAIFEILARSPEAVMHGFVDRNALRNHLLGKEEFVADKFLKRLKSLKQQGFIETEKRGSITSVKLSHKGKIRNIENPFDDRKDGKIRAVSYDIPENLSTKRRLFCRSLNRIGYIQLQKSLWVCKYSKAEQIDLLINELGLEEYVAYFVIEKSNIQQHLNKVLQKV